MAFYNCAFLIGLLSQMADIQEAGLLKNKIFLIKALSPLGGLREYNAKECAQIINSIDEEFFENIGILDKDKIVEVKKMIMIILKEHWTHFNF